MLITRNRLRALVRLTLRNRHFTITIPVVLFALVVAGVCAYEWEYETVPVPEPRSWSDIVGSDTLRCATLKPGHNAYPERISWRAQQFERAEAMAYSLGLKLEVIEADSLQTLLDTLFCGGADMIIYPVPTSCSDTVWYALPCGPLDLSASDTTQWVVSYGADTLRMAIDSLCMSDSLGVPRYQAAVNELARLRKRSRRHRRGSLDHEMIEPYIAAFQHHAPTLQWPWYTLAAIAGQETRFDASIVSAQGARGLMQIMPATGRAHGAEPNELLNADTNIRVATELLVALQRMLRNKMVRLSHSGYTRYDEAPAELRHKVDRDLLPMVLASYNAGHGHVFDAMMLADALGYDPMVWHGNVATCLKLKAQPQYYEMDVCRLGRFNGAFTVRYVENVMAISDQLAQRYKNN